MTKNKLIPQMATINEAAEITGLAKYFIRQLALSNKIITVKAGKKYLINIDKLIEYLNAGQEIEKSSANNVVDIQKII